MFDNKLINIISINTYPYVHLTILKSLEVYTTDEGSCITTETFGYYKKNYWLVNPNVEQCTNSSLYFDL